MTIKRFYKLCCYLALLTFTVQVSWSQNIAPTLTALGNQPYCPQSQINIVTDFNITDPDDTEIEALYIQISTGYEQRNDELTLTGSHPNIVTSWNASEGKLTLHGPSTNPVSYIDLIAAVKAVVFQNTSAQPNDKTFSITIGDANYLPLTDHYYEYVPAYGITWTDARTAASMRTYFGLQGYLATVLYPEEAQLVGEQASGAGWLGGTDVETEGVWKWVTGPEAGTVFWNGGVSGSSPNYAKWNYNEPNNVNGGEDYLHITDPSIGIPGAWNDLREVGEPPGPYYPKGYIVEYGGLPGDPVLNISTSSSIFALKKVEPQTTDLTIFECDNALDGDDKNGYVTFDLTSNEILLLNGGNAADYGFQYYLDAGYVNPISTSPKAFQNTIKDGQIIYVRISSSYDALCYTDTSFNIVVNPVPNIPNTIVFKNCDADGVSDGFTDFNLEEANDYITSQSDLTITYHRSLSDAEMAQDALSAVFNNQNSNTVYARVENANTCFSITAVNLQVSTTAFPEGYFEEIKACDDDDTFDGFREFDLTQANALFLSQFPLGQNLSVHFFENLQDAQLEQNEILQPETYVNQIPFSQIIYVRVESDDNGDCFGIGPSLQLTINPRPEFEVDNSAFYCSNNQPVRVSVINANGNYTYEWQDQNGIIIGNEPYVDVFSGDFYSVIGTSVFGCESFPVRFSVGKSVVAEITLEDITVVEASENNTITINTNNLGIGDYEFALDDEYGYYKEEPFFDSVSAGTHVLYVKDKNGCGTSIPLEIFVLGFPKFFTPNGDGYNDFWQIEGLGDKYLYDSKITVYDRYGKLIKQLTIVGDPWDGTFKGYPLPNSDYWFVAELVKFSGEVKTYCGHFSLIR